MDSQTLIETEGGGAEDRGGQRERGLQKEPSLPARSPILGSFQCPFRLLGEGLQGWDSIGLQPLEEGVGPLTRSWWGDAEADGRCWWEGGPR